MAYSEYLVERVSRRLDGKGEIEPKKMMGGLIFMVNEKMCVGVDKDRQSGDDRLMLRVGKANYEDLLDREGCREMDFTGKPMRGFIFVYPAGFDAEEDLDFWIERALAFNAEAKKSKKRN